MENFKNFFVFLLVISLVSIIGCNLDILDSESNSEVKDEITDITPTNKGGEIIGKIDSDDWDYRNVYFSNAIYTENTEIIFEYAELNDKSKKFLYLRNLSKRNISLSLSELSPPFELGQQSLDIAPGNQDSIKVGFTLKDTNQTYKEKLNVYNSEKTDTITIELSGSDGMISDRQVQRFNLRPAYPNPSSDTVNIELTIPKKCEASLKIYDSENNHFKTLVDDRPLSAGIHTVVWLVNDIKEGIYRAKFKTDNYESHGDIKVEK